MTVSVSFISVPNSQDLSFSMVSRAAKKNVVNPDLAESEDVCLHITQKSSGTPLCDPLHDPSWLRGPALVISMARKCPIYGPSDHVHGGPGIKKPQKIHGFFWHQKTCINHSDQGEVPELDGAFNGKVIDLNEGFPASHVSVPEGMIQHVRLKHNSFRLMTFHSCKNNSLDFEASRSGPGKVFFSTENCH